MRRPGLAASLAAISNDHRTGRIASMDIAAFIEARLAEDEATANAPSPSGSRLNWRAGTDAPEAGDADQALRHYVLSDPDVAGVADTLGLERNTGRAVADHIARHDPARALREVAAKRAILAEHCTFDEDMQAAEPGWERHPGEHPDMACMGCGLNNRGDSRIQDIGDCPTRRAVAFTWADHPDFRPEWAPVAARRC